MAGTFALKAMLDAASYSTGQTMTLVVNGSVSTAAGVALGWAITAVSDSLGHKWKISTNGHSATAKV